jgi:hypothetical protein
MKNPALLLVSILPLAGCTTTAKYESKSAAGPAKPADHPIYVYTETMKPPRPCEIIGSMRVGDTPLTVIGGSLESVLEKLRKNARQRGADALQIKSVDAPGFTSPNYRVEADFLRFTDVWESVSIPVEELAAYLQTNASTLDPIEGVWAGNDQAQSRVAVIKNNARPGREFVAFILSTRNPSWQKGDKKLDIVRGERQGIYRGSFYLDDYQEKKVAITLRELEKKFVVLLPGGSPPVTFTKTEAQPESG